MDSVLRFSCHSLSIDSGRNSNPARIGQFHVLFNSSLPNSAGEKNSQSSKKENEAGIVLLEKYGDGTSKRYIVKNDSQIRTVFEELMWRPP